MRRIFSSQASDVRAGGFSLVELLVSVAILTVITTITLAQHAKFASNLVLTNLAYDIALSVREAQVYGLSVREFGQGSGEFNVGYGVHFDAANQNTYILFVDRNRNEKYDGAQEIVETYTLGRGNLIEEFCASLSSGLERCSPIDISYLDIVFIRPDPDAIIKSSIVSDLLYQSARISVLSPQGARREVSVVATGQISVPQTP